ncbi:MAG: hypothetical protein ACRDA5_01450 [Clostridium sp.]
MFDNETGAIEENLQEEYSEYSENLVNENDDYFGDDASEEGVTDPNAEQEEIDVQDNQEEVVIDEKVENAFAKRLSKEREKLEAQYNPYKTIMEKEAQKYGMSTEEYVQALQVEMAREEEEKNQQIKQEEEERYSYLTKEEREAIKWAKENKSTLEQQQKWDNDARELRTRFPNLKSIDDIPNEAMELYLKYNVPIADAYELINKRLSPNRTELEQQAIRSIKNNRKSNVGSLNNTTSEPPVSISDMSSKDFQNMLDKVKRGEMKGF